MGTYNSALYEKMIRLIDSNPQARITFAQFMEIVLYDLRHGYYSAHAKKIGSYGDYYTSPHLGPHFGELLAEQFFDMWQSLGYPNPFSLVEIGSGQGVLAGDILMYIKNQYPFFFQCLRYVTIEISPALRSFQQRVLHSCNSLGEKIQWKSFKDISKTSIVGCIFSNELVDAFPVHLVEVHNRQLREIYVSASSDISNLTHFQEEVGELSTSSIAEYLSRLGTNLESGLYPNGYRTEVNLAAIDWIKTVADKLLQGYLLTIDYGYSNSQYYSPKRSRGTLACYYRHTVRDNPYLQLGEQDITTHVNFTALEYWGEYFGLQRLGFTRQGPFLMALGLGEKMAELSLPQETARGTNIQEILHRRHALHLSIHPHGLGNWGVLIQGKGLSEQQLAVPLRGLADAAEIAEDWCAMPLSQSAT